MSAEPVRSVFRREWGSQLCLSCLWLLVRPRLLFLFTVGTRKEKDKDKARLCITLHRNVIASFDQPAHGDW